jgi:hypothetical protein
MQDSEKKPSLGGSLPTSPAQPGRGERSRAAGALPCNTAPANCIPGESVRILRLGIDSLYLSYPGTISFTEATKLKTLKELAQSKNPLEQALASYPIGEHQFEVLGKGSGYYPYTLRDHAYRLLLASSRSRKLPLAYVQISSQWLYGRGILPVVAELGQLIVGLGTLEGEPQISRADLYVDFISPAPLDQIQPGAFVSRAKRISTHTMQRAFTGFSIGLGGDLSARLYDKTVEIRESGKRYLEEDWRKHGWQEGETVYRLEFQFMRRILVEHQAPTVPALLLKLGPLWRYAALDWLRLTIPSPTDTTQTRWLLHPVWAALAEVDWPESLPGVSIPVRSTSEPTDRYLFENGLGAITSFMAREGIIDPLVAFDHYYDRAKAYHNARSHFTGADFGAYLQEKAALKAKKFNRPYPGVAEKRNMKLADAVAREYRKLKDGE